MKPTEQIQRRSPVTFKTRPIRTEIRNHWQVVLEYENEAEGPFLIDLSHRNKWDVQYADLVQMQPFGIPIPETPGKSTIKDGWLINRMNQTQAALWDLFVENPQMLQGPAYTEVTDASALFAFIGQGVIKMQEKITSLDVDCMKNEPPFLLQGPVASVPCQVVVLGQTEIDHGILLACSRGYGQSMAETFLCAGEEWGLRPAGETAFIDWVKKLYP
ncbi:MAG: sarcosine oxidase subunit gamma SoxG [Deltaproteobacteria bacterium]|nr:sarcosine oxidase subunit gamma SoxG [Deltaproteobacteria bacterium]